MSDQTPVHPAETDRNLLFGVFPLQADLINSTQFVEACGAWAARKSGSLADLLLERGWLAPADRDHVEYLLRRKLQKHGGDVRASLADLADEDVRQALAGVDDADIRQSL